MAALGLAQALCVLSFLAMVVRAVPIPNGAVNENMQGSASAPQVGLTCFCRVFLVLKFFSPFIFKNHRDQGS